MNLNIFAVFIVIVFLSACASKAPTSIKEIKNTEKDSKKNDIKLFGKDEFIAYIDRSNRINFLCYTNGKSLHDYDDGICSYYNREEHSYDNMFQSEEVFGIGRDGYSPLRLPDRLRCGVGSIYGWVSIIGPEHMEIKDYTALDKEGCKYRFTAIDEPMIVERIAGGMYTFMTSFITAGNLHMRKFDEDAFIDAIHDSNIDSYKAKIFIAIDKYDIDGGFDMVYLEKGNYSSDLSDKYNDLLVDKSKKAGVIFLDEDSKELLSIIVFDKYKEFSLVESISMQIKDMISYLIYVDQQDIKEEDVKKYIPKEIILPKLPEIPTLTKSEYEKKSEFKKRTEEAVAQREATIRDLQREYSSNVLERNNYINKLEMGYLQYLKEISSTKQENSTEFQENSTEFQENMPLLTKVLFLENISGYRAKKFQYNAESEQLFFSISSTHGGYSQSVVAQIPPSNAQSIKEKGIYKILPEIDYKDEQLQLQGFKILDTNSNDEFKVSYTDIDFTPEIISVDVVVKKEKINPKITKTFVLARQKDVPIVDITNKEIWYIDIANRLNARVPQWFINPQKTKDVLAFGEGNSLLEAKHQARNELALRIQANISTRLNSHEVVNNFKHTTEITNNSTQSSDVKLGTDDYSVYKQEQVDGKWYVALKFEEK